MLSLLSLSLVALSLSAQEIPPVVPGFPNEAQVPGSLLSALNAPGQGRTAVIAYHNGVLFTVPEVPSSQPGSDFLVRTWDLSDPTAPAVTSVLETTAQPVMAHGYLKRGDYLSIGPNSGFGQPLSWSFRADGPGTLVRENSPGLVGPFLRGHLFQPWWAGWTFWSYNPVDDLGTLALRGETLAEWDHLGLTGVIGHPFLVGDLLIFASDQSRTGVATYDVSDPTNPVLLDVLTTGGPGGYWPELWGGNGNLYVVFPYRVNGNGMRVVDVTDPTEMTFVADVPLPGAQAMYAQFQDDYAFIGDHKVDMRTFESVLFLDGAQQPRTNDDGVGVDTSQFALPIGNLLITGGSGANQGMAIWAHQAEPDTQGPRVGYHIPQAGRTNYPVGAPISLLIHETLETPTLINGVSFIVRPLGGEPVAGDLTFAFDDILTFTPHEPLAADQSYEVILPEGGIKDAAGNGMQGYSFSFSTGGELSGNRAPSIDSLAASDYPAQPGSPVMLTSVATDPDGDPVEYRFDFGDGSPRTPWSAASSTTHSYAQAGHYRATVQARDPSGAIGSRSHVVTALEPIAGQRPSESSQILCSEAERRVFTVNPDNDSVTAFDADSLTRLWETPVCRDPRAVAHSALAEIWVVCRDDDRIAILDDSGTVQRTLNLPYGSAPGAIVMSPDGLSAFVASEGKGMITRFSTTDDSVTAEGAVGPRPRALGMSADGSSLYVTRLLASELEAEVWEVDTTTLEISRTVTLPKFGFAANQDTTASGRGVANYLTGLSLSPDGAHAWVASNKPNTERGAFFSEELDTDNTVRNIVSRLNLTTGTLEGAIDLDNSDSASAVTFSPLGDYLLVALQGNNEILVLDTLQTSDSAGLGGLVTRLSVELAPQGLCVDPATRRTFVKNFMDRSVTVLETDALFRTGDISIPDTRLPTVTSESLPFEVLRGKQIFYNADDLRMSDEGYLSCASCHLDGGHDGRVWDFTGRGEGFRNTTTLRGRGGTAHGNVHWSANFDEIQDFENDVRGAFGGTGFLSDEDFAVAGPPLGVAKAGLSADLDALAAYVASLGDESFPRSPYRAENGELTAQGVAGERVFASLGCASCHAGPRLTDSTLGTENLHDVGTIRTTSGGRLGGPLLGIDTPTLRGVWNTAPYLHDGSAPELEDVFQVAGGVVIQAESAQLTGGASVVDNPVFIRNNIDNTVHHGAYAFLDNPQEGVRFVDVDGGSGGQGAIEFRYSNTAPSDLEIRVNGSTVAEVSLPHSANVPGWRLTRWYRHRQEGLSLLPGTVNTVEIRTVAGENARIGLDDVTFTTQDHLLAAHPHHQVNELAAGQMVSLLAYLRQLDGHRSPVPDEILFADDFESGNTLEWSATFPPGTP